MLCQYQNEQKKCENNADLLCTICKTNILLCFRHGKKHSSLEKHGCQFIDEKILQNLSRKVVLLEVKKCIIRISEETKDIIATINETAVNTIKHLKTLNKNINSVENFRSINLNLQNIPIIEEKAKKIMKETLKSFESRIQILTSEVSEEKKRRKKTKNQLEEMQNENYQLRNEKNEMSIKIKNNFESTCNEFEIIIKSKDDELKKTQKQMNESKKNVNDLKFIINSQDEQLKEITKKLKSLQMKLKEQKRKYSLYKKSIKAGFLLDRKTFSSFQELEESASEMNGEMSQSIGSWQRTEEESKDFNHLKLEEKREYIRNTWNFISILDLDKEYLLSNDGLFLFICNS